MKRTIAFLLFVILLVSCSPSAITSTITPTETAIAIATIEPTITPTLVPTLESFSGVPRPDKILIDSVVTHYVVAMKMAGIEITVENVEQGLTFQKLTDKDGNPFFVAVTSSTGNSFSDGKVLMIWTAKEGWHETKLKDAELKGYTVATEGSGWLLGNENSMNLARQEVQTVFPDYPPMNWKNLQPSKDKFDSDGLRQIIRKWKNNGFQVVIHAILHADSAELPDWLVNGNYSTAELEQFITNYVTQFVDIATGEGISIGTIIGEPYLPKYRENDFFYRKFGNYSYIRVAVLAAKSANPSFMLIYNDTDNHSAEGLTTSLTKRILKENPEIDYVGIEGHLGDWVRFYNPHDIETTLKGYQRPVVISETDIDLHEMTGDLAQKRLKQAQVAEEFTTASINAGTKIFDFWGLDGNVSWLKNALGQEDSYATMFDENYQPTPYFYSTITVMLLH